MIHSGETVNIIHRMGRLLHQYIVDMYVKIEGERLSFLQNNQKIIQADLYQGLADAISNSDGNVDGSQIGKKRLFCHQVLQEVLDTSTNCIRMQWLLCVTLVNLTFS